MKKRPYFNDDDISVEEDDEEEESLAKKGEGLWGKRK